MRVNRLTLLLAIIFCGLTQTSQLHAQAKTASPNYSLKSPETLEIIEVELTPSSTIIRASIENRVENGYFCLDENTFIVLPGGKKHKMTGVVGLPLCPDQHHFSKKGEKVYFSMTFPPLPGGTGWFDIIEECGEGCLSMYGLTLDKEVNNIMNDAFDLLDAGDRPGAIASFEKALLILRKQNHGLLGSVYINLVSLYDHEGLDCKVEQLLYEINNSVFPYRSMVIANLRAIGYDI